MKYKRTYIDIERLYDIIITNPDFKYDDVQGTTAEHRLLAEYAIYRASLRPPILGGTGMPEPRNNPLTQVHTLASVYAQAIEDVVKATSAS